MNYIFNTQSNDIEKELFYVGIDSIEFIEKESIQIVFDGIRVQDFGVFKGGNILELASKIVPYLFFVNINRNDNGNLYDEIQKASTLGRWFLLGINKNKEGLPAILFIENSIDPEPLSRFVLSLELLSNSSQEVKELNAFFSWSKFPRPITRKISSHLNYIFDGNDSYNLNIYNVGQGSLSAVTNKVNQPLFYFDLGGAFGPNIHTYPTTATLRLCLCKTKTVILSHWDKDHLETARRLFYSNPAFLNGVIWIAPKQHITTSYFKIAAKMHNTGTLLLWSGNRTSYIEFWAGALFKCNGPDKNHSGIALFLKSQDNEEIRTILHPADAAYTYIPLINMLQSDGLVATHHGANFDFNNYPVPATRVGAIAYSHGNCYGHPTLLSVNAHIGSGWNNRRDTTNGHISFITMPVLTGVPCAGQNCDLDTVQIF